MRFAGTDAAEDLPVFEVACGALVGWFGSEAEVARVPLGGHGEAEPVGLQGKLEVGCGEAGPLASEEALVALGRAERLQKFVEVGCLAANDGLQIARAGVVLGMVGGGDEGEGGRVS
jgi:hypothetical protein